MSTPKYQISVVIGRFQPFHNAHQKLIQHALDISEKVIIVLGSHKTSPDTKNPFTSEEREEMIKACYPSDVDRLMFTPVRDHPYSENTWISEIQNAVTNVQEAYLDERNLTYTDVTHHSTLMDVKVALVGFFKDKSSFYLNLFPQWIFESLPPITKDLQTINATNIREAWFEDKNFDNLVPEPINDFMLKYKDRKLFIELKNQHSFNKQYKADTRFVNAPYDPTFITTDTVVTAMGHVLVVRRGFNPGKGCLALPGGFVDPHLTLLDNAIKELKEETRLKVHSDELKAYVKNEKVFDHPYRSLRGRTITFAYHIELVPSLKDGLPLVKGSDDADKAFWMPISSLTDVEDTFFEDHFYIIKYFLGV